MAAFAARASQGHVGRAKRLATDEQARRERRDVLSLPRSLGTVAAALTAARDLVDAAKEEADRRTAPRDAEEKASLENALGVGATGRGVTGARGSAGAVKELEKRQRSRGTRTSRDALDRALVDLAAFYRDVLVVQLGTGTDLVHADLGEQVAAIAPGDDTGGDAVPHRRGAGLPRGRRRRRRAAAGGRGARAGAAHGLTSALPVASSLPDVRVGFPYTRPGTTPP